MPLCRYADMSLCRYVDTPLCHAARRGGLRARSLARIVYRLLCVPSQNGLLEVFLQPHNQTFLVSSMVNFIGENSLPLWVPSQKGCLADFPQEHHQ